MKSALRYLFIAFATFALFAGQAPDMIWISFDGGAVPAVRQALAERGMKLRLDNFRKGDGIAVAQVDRTTLATLGALFHEQFNRCGGYLVHESALAAHTVKTLQALRRQTTAKAQLVAYSIDHPEDVAALLDEVDESQILDVIQQLSSFQNRFFDTQSGVDAAIWLRDTWSALAQGLQGVSAELYTHSFAQPSVILTIEGSVQPDEIVVLGAHLDSINRSSTLSPGADDDASGIACLTEVLRCMAATGFQPSRTVKFMGYAGEEHGLLGSQAIASAYFSAQRNIVGVLQLDMTNYQGSSQDIWMIQDFTNGPQNNFITQLAGAYLPELSVGTTTCGYGCSDHASWYNQGYPASIPFESRFGEYNPFIHSASDTLAASGNHAHHAAKFARLAACYLVEMAKGERVAPPGHNNRIDLTLLLTMKAAYGACGQGGCPMDLDGDGDIDGQDSALLYPEWAGVSCLDFGDGPACVARSAN